MRYSIEPQMLKSVSICTTKIDPKILNNSNVAENFIIRISLFESKDPTTMVVCVATPIVIKPGPPQNCEISEDKLPDNMS